MRDFEDGTDLFDLNGTTFSALSITQAGADTQIALGTDVLATVQNTAAADVTRMDFTNVLPDIG